MTSAPSVSDLLNLRGKVALVTGASAGIGRGVATRLSDAGAAIAVHYRGGKEDADALASTLRGKGRKSLSVYAELSDSQSVERAIGTITDELGAIDILVNNAARQTACWLRGNEHRGMARHDGDKSRGRVRRHQGGCRRMVARGSGGAIVNIASIEGLQPAPTHGHYAVSKAGLIMFTRAAALQYGKHGIRVNAVSPGRDPSRRHRDGVAGGRGALDEGRAARAHGRGRGRRRRRPFPGFASLALDHRRQSCRGRRGDRPRRRSRRDSWRRCQKRRSRAAWSW